MERVLRERNLSTIMYSQLLTVNLMNKEIEQRLFFTIVYRVS